jgi:hypothetical protein
MRPRYEKNILLSSSRAFLLSTPMENNTVVQLKSFLVAYSLFLVVYPYGKQ